MNEISTPKPTWQLKAFPLFTLLGWALIATSFILGVFVLAPLSAGYWGGEAKVVRDAAQAGSQLLGWLQFLAATPRWLEALTFLGVAAFMTGIALEFSTIPAILENRGEVMQVCFPLIAQAGAQQEDRNE